MCFRIEVPFSLHLSFYLKIWFDFLLVNLLKFSLNCYWKFYLNLDLKISLEILLVVSLRVLLKLSISCFFKLGIWISICFSIKSSIKFTISISISITTVDFMRCKLIIRKNCKWFSSRSGIYTLNGCKSFYNFFVRKKELRRYK